MKYLLFLLVVYLFTSTLFSFKYTEQNNYSLSVKVSNLKNDKGLVQFTLYNKDGTIPDEEYKNYFKILKSKIENGVSKVTFKDLPKGKYAMNILHDENKNGKIDKGIIFPKEGVGFSNFESIGFSNRPNFNKASFEINDNKTLSVKVIYF